MPPEPNPLPKGVAHTSPVKLLQLVVRHTVPEDSVPPTDALVERSEKPKLSPDKVMLAPPLVGPFSRST
jgi:hypothetical protein